MTDYERISQLINDHGLSGAEIARKSGVSESAISKMMKAKRNLHPDNSRKIQVALGIRDEWWATGKGVVFTDKPTPVGKSDQVKEDLLIETLKSNVHLLKEKIARLEAELSDCLARSAVENQKK